MPLSPLAARYDQFILDLDGCVWVGGEPTPGRRRRASRRCATPASGSRSPPTTRAAPREDYVTQLWRIGVQASLADVVTVGGAVQHLLAETRTGRTAFVIGTAACAAT